MGGDTKENKKNLKTQVRWYIIGSGVFLCLLFAAAFLLEGQTKGNRIGYAVMCFAGIVLFLSGLWFLRKIMQDITDSVTYMEQKFEKISKGDFSGEPEAFAPVLADFWKLAEYIEMMRENADSQRKRSEQEAAALSESIEKLCGQIGRLQQQMTETSASAEDIAASMEEISAASVRIDQFSKEVQASVSHTASRMKQSEEEVNAVSIRAEGIREEALKRRQLTRHNHLSVKDSLSRSLKTIQSVEEISALTEAVMELAEKMNMLSLNASIEAAKAGQAGNGFSLVADEIRKLADESGKKAENIQWIAGEAHYAIDSLKEDSNELLHFVDSKVISDFDFFLDMADAYSHDAENMRDIVLGLKNIYEEMTSSMERILESAEQIDQAARRSFAKTAELTEGAADIAETAALTEENFRKAGENTQKLKNL